MFINKYRTEFLQNPKFDLKRAKQASKHVVMLKDEIITTDRIDVIDNKNICEQEESIYEAIQE